MAERRKAERRSISYYMRIVDSGANQMIGHLSDITLQGLKMDSQKTLPENEKYRLRINTTADVADKDYIEFVARSRWCQPDPLQTGLYEIGFEIIKIAPHDAEIVQRIVDKYSARENNFKF
jgi:c-di-GMP-binding flagellar brake protein YcgR